MTGLVTKKNLEQETQGHGPFESVFANSAKRCHEHTTKSCQPSCSQVKSFAVFNGFLLAPKLQRFLLSLFAAFVKRSPTLRREVHKFRNAQFRGIYNRMSSRLKTTYNICIPLSFGARMSILILLISQICIFFQKYHNNDIDQSGILLFLGTGLIDRFEMIWLVR